MRGPALLAVAATLGCPSAAPAPPGPVALAHTELAVHVPSREATASLLLVADGRGTLTLPFGELVDPTVTAASADDGGDPPEATIEAGALVIAAPRAGVQRVELAYAIPEAPRFEGWWGDSTVTWPVRCGNLAPCLPHPSLAATFAVTLSGLDAGLAAVAGRVSRPAPAYQLAFAYGPYERRELGATAAGTRLVAFVRPEDDASATPGLDPLPAIVEALEDALGPAPFGPEIGPVAVDWGAGVRGGMEHHPYWHVARASMGDAVVQAHEAAHGWFGDGVRLRCWEDLVLSEGVASYLAPVAVGAALGPEREAQAWAWEEARLANMLGVGGDDAVARPDGCSSEDPVADGIFGRAVYVKGALFLRDVEDAVGRPALLAALGAFVDARLGQSAGLDDLLGAIAAETGFDPEPLAAAWLRGLGAPDAD